MCWVRRGGIPAGNERPLVGIGAVGRLVKRTQGTGIFLGDLWVKGRSSGTQVLGTGGVGRGWVHRVLWSVWIPKGPALNIPCCHLP